MSYRQHEFRVQVAAHPIAYPVLRGLRRFGPAVRVRGLGVVVNDAGTARRLMVDGASFHRGGGSAADLWTAVFGPSVLLNMDGPEHTTMRRKLRDFFTPAYVDQLCAGVLGEPLARLSDRLERGGRVDVVDATRVMSGAVTSALIGFDVAGTLDEREAAYRGLVTKVDEITAMVKMGRMRLTPAQIARAKAIAAQVGAAAGRAWREGDENTAVGRMRGSGLTEEESRGLASAFLIAGTETISSLIPRLVALLHDHGDLPRIAEALRAGDNGPLDAATTEAVRLITPTPIIMRYAARESTVGRVTVHPGERILISTVNCAKAYGPFDLSRSHPPEIRRLWFGAGPHFCLGYPLAMAEVYAIVGAVLRHGPVRVVRRRAARGVFFPAYRTLDVVRA